MFVGSDAIALAPFTDAIVYLEDGDWAVLDAQGHRHPRPQRQGGRARRSPVRSPPRCLVDKGNHRHFMAKEIHEQPEVIGHTLAAYVDLASNRVDIPALPFDFANAHPTLALGLRHRLLCLPRRQILVRALGEASRRCRYRL